MRFILGEIFLLLAHYIVKQLFYIYTVIACCWRVRKTNGALVPTIFLRLALAAITLSHSFVIQFSD